MTIRIGNSILSTSSPVFNELASKADLEIKADKATTLTGYGITDGLNKSGDTMTGNLDIRKDDPYLNFRSITTDSSVTSSSFQNLGTVMVRDKTNQITGYMQNSLSSGNLVQTSVGARRRIDGTDKTSSISVSVDGSGNAFCYFPKCTTKATTTSSAADNKVAVITQNYVNGYSWYRIWSDGWIEQGGKTDKISNASATVSFLRNFANTNSISIKIQPIGGDTNNWAGQYYCVKSFTTSNFTFVGASGASSGYFWEAKGYIS